MIIDRGFFVDNYVGHYHMQDHKGEKYIVSEEQRFSKMINTSYRKNEFSNLITAITSISTWSLPM